MKSKIMSLLGLFLLVLVFSGSASANYTLDSAIPAPALAAVGTGFTYQGYIEKNGLPANGTFDFEFFLYDDVSTGSQIGSVVSLSGVSVNEGLITVVLDFGDVFDGTALWLEIHVQGPGDSGFTTLVPRQPITPTPYAINADKLDGLDSSNFASTGHSHVVSKTEYLSIPGSGFQCAVPTTSCISSQQGYKWGNNSSMLLTIAPVHLPDTSVVTEFQCFWVDSSSSVDVDISIILRRTSFNVGSLPNYQDLASLADSTTGTSNFILTDSTTSISNSVIDNANYGYFIYYTMARTSSPDLLDGLIRNYGCRIEYSLDETIP